MRFLIDECLSPLLVSVAAQSGYEAYHIAHLEEGGLDGPGGDPLGDRRGFYSGDEQCE